MSSTPLSPPHLVDAKASRAPSTTGTAGTIRGTGPHAAAGTDAPGSTPVLAVVARPPSGPGIKTRLAADIGTEAARSVYSRLLGGTLETVAQVAGDGRLGGGVRAVVAWAADPGGVVPGPPRGPIAWSAMTQRGPTLAARLASLFADLFAEGHSAVVVLSSDSPALPPVYLRQALALLEPDGAPSAVVGPTTDGGFYLFGLARSAWTSRARQIRTTLEEAALGTSRARSGLERGLRRLDLPVASLPFWVDVDVAADLPLAARLEDRVPDRAGPAPCLKTVYLHVTHRCDGGCPHCYDRDSRCNGRELGTQEWLEVVAQAVGLGARHFQIIGGDPFLRPDLLDLVSAITGAGASVRLFVSRELDAGGVAALATASGGRLTPILSIDGPTSVNDLLRGAGRTAGALATGRRLAEAGMVPVVNTVLSTPVLDVLHELPGLLAPAGLTRLHLVLPHRRGGAAARPELVPETPHLLRAVERLLPAAHRVGVTVDNIAAWRARFGAPRDLCDAACSLLTVGPDGGVYGCPITCGDPAFEAGRLGRDTLQAVWQDSPAFALLRQSRAGDRETCMACTVLDACGGECWVQAHYDAAAAGRPAGPRAPFPYCGLVRPLLEGLAEGQPGRADPHRKHESTPFDCI